MKVGMGETTRAGDQAVGTPACTRIHGAKIEEGIPVQVAREIVGSLNTFAADLFLLYLKTKYLRWNTFDSVRRKSASLIDDNTSQLFYLIDDLSERVRALGGIVVGSVTEIQQSRQIHDSTTWTLQIYRECFFKTNARSERQ